MPYINESQHHDEAIDRLNLAAECDRLKAINAELLEALQRINNLTDPSQHAVHSVTEARQWVRQSHDVARAAIAKAMGK